MTQSMYSTTPRGHGGRGGQATHGKNLVVGSWMDISEGCPMSYRVDGSDLVSLTLGTGVDAFDFSADAAALRSFVQLGNKALAEMDSRHAQEEADRKVVARRALADGVDGADEVTP